MAYSEYRDLTPIDRIENGDEYIEALNWAFQNKKVKNIALTGPYGAGKSSIIETFLRKNDEDKSATNRVRSSALKISMATFLKGNTATNDPNGKIQVDADEVEKGILKQLFYKVEPGRIPQSRYRKLHPIKKLKTFLYVLVTMLVILFFMEAMTPTTCDKFMKVIESVVSPVLPNPIFTKIAAVLLFAFFTWIITCLYRTAISKFRVKEIKLPTDTTVQNGVEEADSVFNRNLDEIMYFFEETGYKTVFFEDLDRLDDPKIFVHLRELNNLLNNDDAIKAKPIVFVYAVRDDIFSKEDRTKFFDFIIPVIPVINSTNSGEILLQRLQEAKENGIEHDVSQGCVLDIAPFISDMRILQNIYNEFVIYKKTLRMSQELSLSDEQMLAMLVFKNLYPSDFADIQNEKGILKKAFIDKSDFIDGKKQSIQDNIDNYSSSIRSAQNDTCKSIRELKYAMLGTLMGGPYKFDSFRNSNWNSSGVETNTIMSDDYDMVRLMQENYRYIYYMNQNHNQTYTTFDAEILATFVERWKAIKEVGEKGLENLQAELEELRERQHKLSGMSIVDLLKVYPANEVFSENVKANKLLVFLLRRGYIDEKYASYINYFKGTSITKDDMNFILAVKNQTPLDFNYHLTKIPMVVERLQAYEFEQKAIYNFDLLEELLGEENSEKLMAFIQQLADGDELSWRFIDEFVNRTSKLPLFIRLLSENWTGMWAYISANETLTYDHQLMYLQNILSESEISTIEAQNKDSCMTHYFEEHADILQKLRDCNNEKIIFVIDSLDVHFPALSTATVPSNVLDSIFEKRHYVMNEEMIKTIVTYKNSNFIDEFEGKPYSILITLNYPALLQYVQDNMVAFVDKIVLAHRRLSDSPEDIVDMLIRLEGKTGIQVKLVEQESFCMDCIDDCAGEHVRANKNAWMPVWNALLKKNAVKVSWENVFDYWKVYQFSEALKEYVNLHAEELAEIDAAVVDDSFIKAFIKADFEQEIEQKLLPVLRLEKFDIEISAIAEPTLRIMVDCNYFDFTADRYIVVKDVSSEIGIKFILKNQEDYMSLSDSIPMTSSLLEQLVFNDDFAVNNRHQLFCDYAESYMTEKIAMQMKAHNLPVSKDIFKAAWNCTAQDDHIELLLDYCTILNAEELEQYFAELGAPYSELSDRSRRHEVSLPVNDKNKALAEHLKKIGYLTNWEEKAEKYFDAATKCEKTRKILRLRIKQVK
jgi:hypothetical protein